MVASGKGLLTAGLEVARQLSGAFGLQAFVPAIVHHHQRRPIARAQTFHFNQGESAGRIGSIRLDAQRRHQLFGHPFGAAQRARQRAAHLDDELPHRLRVEHRVERDDVLDIGRGAPNHRRDMLHRAQRDVSELPLHEKQRGQNRRLPPFGRIPLRDLLEPSTILRLVDKHPPIVVRHLPCRSMRFAIVELRMKGHLSTSPITTSIDPITAMTSAISPPMIICGSAWHASSDGDRDFTRHGRLVPSETT